MLALDFFFSGIGNTKNTLLSINTFNLSKNSDSNLFIAFS